MISALWNQTLSLQQNTWATLKSVFIHNPVTTATFLFLSQSPVNISPHVSSYNVNTAATCDPQWHKGVPENIKLQKTTYFFAITIVHHWHYLCRIHTCCSVIGDGCWDFMQSDGENYFRFLCMLMDLKSSDSPNVDCGYKPAIGWHCSFLSVVCILQFSKSPSLWETRQQLPS